MAEEADAPSRSRFRSLLLLLPCCRNDADDDAEGPRTFIRPPTSPASPLSFTPLSLDVFYDDDDDDHHHLSLYDDDDDHLSLYDVVDPYHGISSDVYKGGSVSSATAHRVEVRIPESKEESGDITETGDIAEIIRLEKYDIEVRIPPNNAYSAKDITVEVINEVPPELKIKETEAIITYGLKMKAPHNATFEHPVQVTMPHSAIFTKPSKAEIIAYYRKSASGEFVAIPSTEGSVPCCVVRERNLDIYFKHFCEYWFVSLRNKIIRLQEIFIGKRLVCTPYVPMPPFLSGMQVLLVHIRDAHKKEEKAPTGYTAPFEGDDFLFVWGSGPMEITCPQSTMGDSPKVLEERVIRYCKDHKPTFELDTTNTREAKMNVKFVLKQSTRSELLVPMNLIALSYGKSESEPVIAPSTSTSVPPQDDCQVHGCQKRKIPDDLLNRLAKDIPSGNYYDLCEKLEYGYNQADNILAKHKTDFTKATRECFAGWTNKATRNLADLHKVLFSAGLGGKIDHTRKV